MKPGNFAVELAEHRVAQETQAGIARARAELALLIALVATIATPGLALAQPAAGETGLGVPRLLSDWLGLIALLIAVGGTIYTRMTAGASANAVELEKHGEKLGDFGDRLAVVENDIAHLPDREASHRLELTMEKLNGRLNTLDEKLKPVSAISERMQEVLLEQARK